MFYLGLAIEALGPDAARRWGAPDAWIAEAASAGLPEAQYRLAQIALARGDRALAIRQLDLAAAAGLADAQFNRARLASGEGDMATARRLYTDAARQGHGLARFNLALALLNGDAKAAPVEALAWLMLAAEQDVANAAAAARQLAAALTPDERAEAARLAETLR